MTIYLVQHGKSVPKEENPERPLSEQGRREVEKIAVGLKDYNIHVNFIYHTSKLRAVQTAQILHNHVHAAHGLIQTEGMNPNDDVRSFVQNITLHDQAMFVGHLPFMERFVSYLVAGDEEKLVFKFQNAGVIILQYSEEQKKWYISGSFLPQPV
jgi:phosphohistidine phosphatase